MDVATRSTSASNQSNSSQMTEEKTKDMADLQLAYKDQGYHEMEFTSGNESELLEKKVQCQKNPGHPEFIPATEFSMDHLPERWRDSLLFDFITTLIGLTVRLAVKYTSSNRPPNYPLYNRRGQYGLTAFASGWVCAVKRKFTEKNWRTCPCATCKQSPHLAKTQWGEFYVDTACHVVFDYSEVRHARCDLFYDRDGDINNCPSLEGVSLGYSATKEDWCRMICITHDENASNKLEEMLDRYSKLREEIHETYKRCVDRKETAVVISHPHGQSKYVTVGEVTHRMEGFLGKWKYSAETCPGSSGGFVYILGECDEQGRLLGPRCTSHSGCQQKGQNESTGWEGLA